MKKNDALQNDDVDADAYDAPTALSTASGAELSKLFAESSRSDDPPVEATKLMATAPGNVPALSAESDGADTQGATMLYPSAAPHTSEAPAPASTLKSRFPFPPPEATPEPKKSSLFDGPWLLAFIVFCGTLFVAGLIFYLTGS